MAGCAAVVALLDMAAKCGCAAGDDGAPCLGLVMPERVPGKPGLPVNAQDVGQFDVAASGHDLMPGVQAGEQVEWRIGLGHLLAQMQVAGCRVDLVVAHQGADGMDVDARFQQMGGERVP